MISSLNVWWNLSRKPFGPGAFFIGRFLIIDSIYLINIGLFRLWISPCMNLDKLCFSRNWSISSKLLFKIFLYCPFNVHEITIDGPSFISDTSNLCLFSFFFSWLAWLEFYQFYLIQRTSSWFCWFSLLFYYFQFNWLLL